MKCPGQDLSRKKIEEVAYDLACPKCGCAVEFFFDDRVRVCPECGTRIEKSENKLLKDFGCASWCLAAESCLGPKLYSKFNEVKEKLIQDKKVSLKMLLDSLPESEVELRAFFIRAFNENTDLELLINPEKSIWPMRHTNPEMYKKAVLYYSKFTGRTKS